MDIWKLEPSYEEREIQRQIESYQMRYYERPIHLVISESLYSCLVSLMQERFGDEDNQEIKYLYGLRIIRTKRENTLMVV